MSTIKQKDIYLIPTERTMRGNILSFNLMVCETDKRSHFYRVNGKYIVSPTLLAIMMYRFDLIAKPQSSDTIKLIVTDGARAVALTEYLEMAGYGR